MARLIFSRITAALAVALPLAAPPVPAQEPAPADSARVAAGAHYAASGFHRFFFGNDYRQLWTTPITVPVLDLERFGGGLTVLSKGGGQQTLSLRFRAADGRLWSFRSIDKDPSAVLPPDLQGTVADRVVQDQISAAQPVGPVVVDPILEAAGVLHASPLIVVLPDHPGLGRWREEFAGMLGTFEERVQVGDTSTPGFERFERLLDSDPLLDLLAADPAERLDARAFLTARLVDLYVGDWDRHRGQWRWAKPRGGGPWLPVPEDRDQAFVRFDGFLLMVARHSVPQLVKFDETYPSPVGPTWNGRDLDRRLLVALGRAEWDSVARSLQVRLTDSVIAVAVGRMPAEHRAVMGDALAETLRRRRDGLPAAAESYYRLLAEMVDVHGTDRDDRVTVDRRADGAVDVTVSSASVDQPLLRRRLEPRDTKELRLYLEGGDDLVVVRGPGRGIAIRVVGGPGADHVADSSRAGGVRFYDEDGATTSGTRGVAVDRRPYVAPGADDPHPVPPRDWGSWTRPRLWMSFGPDVGLFAGGGFMTERYGFRKHPFAARVGLRAGVASQAETYRAEFTMELRRENSDVRTSLLVRASGIEILRFYGFGNETPVVGSSEFHKVSQDQYMVAPTVHLPLGRGVELALGPVAKYSDTDPEDFILLARPYGFRSFGQVGLRGGLTVDGRDRAGAPSRGVAVALGGAVYPGVWDVARTFGEAHGTASAYLSPAGPGAVLALRVGGKKVFGTFPFHEAAFLGGAATVRGWHEQRFAGEAAVWGNAELRLRLTRTFLVVPTDFGIFGLADGGRVFVDGESSDVWHSGVGGGIWLAFLEPENTVSLAVARGQERTAVYARAGFAF